MIVYLLWALFGIAVVLGIGFMLPDNRPAGVSTRGLTAEQLMAETALATKQAAVAMHAAVVAERAVRVAPIANYRRGQLVLAR